MSTTTDSPDPLVRAALAAAFGTVEVNREPPDLLGVFVEADRIVLRHINGPGYDVGDSRLPVMTRGEAARLGTLLVAASRL